MSFQRLHDEWKAWAATADRAELDWAGDYPGWRLLLDAAAAEIRAPGIDNDVLLQVAELLALDDDDEYLLDLIKKDVTAYLSALVRLVESPLDACRWQIYDAAPLAGAAGEQLLRRGLDDPESYARRRAVLALARMSPPDARALFERYFVDADVYLRMAALDLAMATRDATFLRDVRARALRDPEEFVRRRAETLMP